MKVSQMKTFLSKGAEGINSSSSAALVKVSNVTLKESSLRETFTDGVNGEQFPLRSELAKS
jgi:hypothetical protein